MLGIVKIYSKKVQYFMSDCQEAMWYVPPPSRPLGPSSSTYLAPPFPPSA